MTVARALEYEAYEDARQALAEVFRSNEFVQRVVTYVRAQGGVEEEQVVSHMARTAGVKRTSEFLTGARALLELIEVSGLLEHDGDAVRVPTRRESAAAQKPPPEKPVTPRTRAYGGDLGYVETAAPGVTLHLNLSPADLKTDAAADELAARIKRLLDALSST